jgi:hypothetical protein
MLLGGIVAAQDNSNELVSPVGIVEGRAAIEGYAQATGQSITDVEALIPADWQAQGITLPEPQQLQSQVGILEGQAAIEAYARASGISLGEAEAIVAEMIANAEAHTTSIGQVQPNAFGYYHGDLPCNSPNQANVFFNVGRGVITLSFHGQFALQGGGTTDRANTFWDCTQDICILWGWVTLTGTDWTDNYDIYNLLNTIDVKSQSCGAVA